VHEETGLTSLNRQQALRFLTRASLLGAAIFVTLALSIGFTTAIFSVLDAVNAAL